MVVIIGHMHPGSQPLPKVEPFLITLLRMVLPDPPMAGRFDASKLDAVKKEFTKEPRNLADGGGCMLSAYDALSALYGPGFSKKLMEEVHARAKEAADNGMKTQLFKQKVEQAKAANPNLTDADARKLVWKDWHSAHNTSDHMYALMAEKGLAENKVHTPNKDAEQAIRDMTPPQPGAYYFGLTVKGHHTVTLVVEKFADGTHKMSWLDQHTEYDPKHQGGGRFESGDTSREIKQGKLGDALDNWVFNGPETTNIYAFRPPAGKAP